MAALGVVVVGEFRRDPPEEPALSTGPPGEVRADNDGAHLVQVRDDARRIKGRHLGALRRASAAALHPTTVRI